MFSISGDRWPYVLLTIGWIAVFGYLIRRVIKAGPNSHWPSGNATPEQQKLESSRDVDTQAGRM